MTVYGAIRKAARKRKRQLVEELSRRAADDGDIDFGNFRDELEALTELETLRTPFGRVLYAIIPIVVAVMLLAPLWRFHYATTEIDLNAVVDRISVDLDLSKELDLGGISLVRGLRAEGLDSLGTDVGGVDFLDGEGRGSGMIEGLANIAHIRVKPSKLEGESENQISSGRLTVSRQGELVHVETMNLALQLDANLQDPAQVVSTLDRTIQEATLSDASLEFRGASTAKSTTRFFFEYDGKSVAFPLLKPTDLSLRNSAFNAEQEKETFSSIINGTLTMSSTGQQHELQRGTDLTLGGLDGTLRILLKQDGLHLSFHGAVSAIGFGSDVDHLIRDLRPSIAESMSSDRTIALVWSSFLFLFGLLWTARQLVVGSTK